MCTVGKDDVIFDGKIYSRRRRSKISAELKAPKKSRRRKDKKPLPRVLVAQIDGIIERELERNRRGESTFDISPIFGK